MATYNVVFDSSSRMREVVKALKALKVTVNLKMASLRVVNITTDASITDLRGIKGVVAVEEEKTVTAHTQAWQQLRVSGHALPMPATYEAAFQGRDVVVYLVDSGVNMLHPELIGANIHTTYTYTGDFTDQIGHGTVLATLIVGQTIGISPRAEIRVVKIPTGESIPVTQILLALEAVLVDHNINPSVVKVVNCSWIIEKSEILDSKISELESAGLIVVAAAGNQGVAAETLSPIGLDSVLGVGACDAYDRVLEWAPGSSSNWGPDVDITAPGIDVQIINDDGTSTTASGTSLSAAITSGVLCHFIEQSPSKNAVQIQQELVDTGLVNVLFRNETIYGTTPDVLLHTPSVGDVGSVSWGVSQRTQLIVAPGGTSRLSVPFTSPITTVSIGDYVFPNRLNYIAPVWAAFDSVNKEIFVNPSDDLPTGKYPIFLSGSDANNNTYLLQIVVVVGSEVNAESEPEMYLTPTGEYVDVRLQFCNTNEECDVYYQCILHQCLPYKY